MGGPGSGRAKDPNKPIKQPKPRGRPLGSKDPFSLAKLKFARNRAQARFRGVEFKFTFEEWYLWWLNHNIDKNDPADNFDRGSGTTPCMARLDLNAGYEPSNVYLATQSEKGHDQIMWRFQQGTAPSQSPQRSGRTGTK